MGEEATLHGKYAVELERCCHVEAFTYDIGWGMAPCVTAEMA
jgi:hypothetical protein